MEFELYGSLTPHTEAILGVVFPDGQTPVLPAFQEYMDKISAKQSTLWPPPQQPKATTTRDIGSNPNDKSRWQRWKATRDNAATAKRNPPKQKERPS